ncbi:MAG: hypothetical protein E6J33_12215 [Chloroflexi bacterium]|nr:MAG: hypothetical protein E6J33_12215 [Chloroflexota bacterium]
MVQRRAVECALRRHCVAGTRTASRRSDNAPVTVLVFSEFEPFPCARAASLLAAFSVKLAYAIG